MKTRKSETREYENQKIGNQENLETGTSEKQKTETENLETKANLKTKNARILQPHVFNSEGCPTSWIKTLDLTF